MEKLPEDNWIDRYNEDDISDEERRIFQERLKDHARLRTEFHLDKELGDFLGDTEAIDLRYKIEKAIKGKRRRNLPWWPFMAAAAAAFMAAIGIAFFLFSDYRTGIRKLVRQGRDQHPQKVMTLPERPERLAFWRNRPSARPVSDRWPDTGNFRNDATIPSKEYEFLVGKTIRSAGITLTSPDPVIQISTEGMIMFRMEGEGGHDQKEIVLMNNRGETVRTLRIYRDKALSVPADSLGHGLFYWKVLDGGEVVRFGKILIR